MNVFGLAQINCCVTFPLNVIWKDQESQVHLICLRAPQKAYLQTKYSNTVSFSSLDRLELTH